MTELDTSILAGQADLRSDLQSAGSYAEVRQVLIDSGPKSEEIFDRAVEQLQTLGAASSPGGQAVYDDILQTLRDLLDTNAQAAAMIEQFQGTSAQDLQRDLLGAQQFIGRQEVERDMHQPLAERAKDTGDAALVKTLRADPACSTYDDRQAEIGKQLGELYN